MYLFWDSLRPFAPSSAACVPRAARKGANHEKIGMEIFEETGSYIRLYMVIWHGVEWYEVYGVIWGDMGWYGVIGCYRWKIRGLSFIIHHGLWWFIILSAQRPGVLSPSFARGWPLQWFSSRDLGAGKSWNMVEPAKMERHYKAKDIYKHTRIYKDHKGEIKI